jgi:charged multivesicular body protein 4
MNLFGKKSTKAAAAPVQPPVDTFKLMRDNLDLLEKREEHLNKKIEMAIAEAKQKSLKKDKNGALFALKRKKLLEAEISKIQGARITLDSQILSLESASVNVEVFKAVKAGAGAMKAIRGNIDADKVEEIMEDIEEEKDIHNSISEAISRPGRDIFDDEDLLNELAELEALDAEEKMLSNPTITNATTESVFKLPSVPTSGIVSKTQAIVEESEEERSLKELQASMLA